jgi:hypothetical protein
VNPTITGSIVLCGTMSGSRLPWQTRGRHGREDVDGKPRLALLAIVFLAGCAAPAATPSTDASPTPAETIYVRHPSGSGSCPLAALPPRPLTFRIDPAAARPQHVVAVDAHGEPHDVFWDEGFTGGTLSDPVVRDPAGEVIAQDGEVFAEPDEQGQPRLHGYMVCSGSNHIYVLLPGRE